jgi:hypothetical protein
MRHSGCNSIPLPLASGLNDATGDSSATMRYGANEIIQLAEPGHLSLKRKLLGMKAAELIIRLGLIAPFAGHT